MVDVGNNVKVGNIGSDILDAKEEARIQKLISNLYVYDNDPRELTKLYTNILLEDNVAYILTKVSQDPIFFKHFPEFYERNQYGENVINCQQNNSFHRYGVFKHILVTIESVGSKELPIGDWQRKVLKWTMLLHDIGKPYVKVINQDGSESFANHDEKSVEIAKTILDRFYFTDEEKYIILTLIKYHDRYINEGEIIFDNLKFLASELKNNKELFFMLIDVKEADAKAKSIDVYNKYKLTKKKYIDFLNSYFAYNPDTNNIEASSNTSTQAQNTNVVSVSSNGEYEDINLADDMNKNIKSLKLNNIIEDAIKKQNVSIKYQPIIDLKTKLVYGYEAFSHIEAENINIAEIINYAQNTDRYDKLQQTLFINAIENFSANLCKEAELVFVNIDISSFNKYINKPRLYDLMQSKRFGVDFQGYERENINTLKSTINTIHENKGTVVLDNFGRGTFTVKDLNVLDVDYIIPEMSFIRNIDTDEEKQKYINELVTYCIGREIKIIAIGVETKEELNTLQRLGVRYVQGNYLAKPNDGIDIINGKLSQMLTDKEDDAVV